MELAAGNFCLLREGVPDAPQRDQRCAVPRCKGIVAMLSKAVPSFLRACSFGTLFAGRDMCVVNHLPLVPDGHSGLAGGPGAGRRLYYDPASAPSVF